ncbi:MAG: hydroxymethylglutaryl-CoA lyase [Myxococcales bacterium]|nr:hydroxymethylglutaryl-CoA lyase [Myxococcales bacterium]
MRLFEVCLRDGLQNEAVVVPTEEKLALARALVGAGFKDIEVTSFVRPRWVPQLADAAEVVRELPDAPDVRFWALVPNAVGLDRAMETGLRHICTFMSSSETHNLKNVNRTIKESLAETRKVIAAAKSDGMSVRSYLSTSFGSPYEGAVDPARVESLALSLLEAGADEIALGDTTGMGHPAQVVTLVRRLVAAGIAKERIALHFHDTRGTALVNVWAAWQEGITTFDGSVSGVGGCPYAPGAAGNACTQDLIHLFERLDERQEPTPGMGPVTGVDLDRVGEIGVRLEEALGRPLPGRFHQYWKGHKQRRAQRSA